MSAIPEDPGIKGTGQSLARTLLSLSPLDPLLKLEDLRAGILRGFAKRKEQDLDAFLSELARRAQDDGHNFGREFIDQAFSEKGISQILAQAVHAALAITDGQILATLAHITYHYRINQKDPDMFFRGFVELLKRIGIEELRLLREVTQTSNNLLQSPGAGNPNVFLISSGLGNSPTTTVSIQATGSSSANIDSEMSVPFQNTLISLGLAAECSGQTWTSLGTRVAISIDRKTIEQLSRFLL